MNLRIAMVIATYFPVWGGAQVQLRQICRKLSAKGVSCFILTRRLPGTKNFEVINGIPVYRIYVTGKSKIIDSFLFISLSILWFLNNKDVFDAIHCYQAYSPATIGIITTLILRSKKVIVKVTSSDEYGEVAEIKKLPLYNIRISLLRRADRFLAVNKKVTEELIGLGIRRDMISYLPNGVEVPLDSCYDYSSKMNYRRRLGLDYARLACFTGRITREKNLEALITAWGYVIKQCSDAHLMFVGEGGAERNILSNIKELCAELKLDEYVHFAGKTDEVFEYLLASDIFVLPSISEGLSNSLLEAMAAGAGIVAGDNEGNRQLIYDGINGFLVEPRDISKLSSAILCLLRNESLMQEFGKKAKETVISEYSIDKIADRQLSLYEEVLGLRK